MLQPRPILKSFVFDIQSVKISKYLSMRICNERWSRGIATFNSDEQNIVSSHAASSRCRLRDTPVINR